jgi:hypothetical protein
MKLRASQVIRKCLYDEFAYRGFDAVFSVLHVDMLTFSSFHCPKFSEGTHCPKQLGRPLEKDEDTERRIITI